MSFTNFIDDGNATILQGINGIRLFEESWVTEKVRRCKKGGNGNPKICQNGEKFLHPVNNANHER